MNKEPQPIFRQLDAVPAFSGTDGASIRELAGRSTGLASHSLAMIAHPPGTATVAHHHKVADEVYFVSAGRGRIRVDDVTRDVASGDIVQIRQGQSHKLWSEGPGDLVLIVTCGPAYGADEVIWDE